MSTTPMGMRQTKHIFVGETRIATKNNWWQDTGTEYEKYNTYWYHADHLGSAQLVSNWKGEEYERIEYTPYGEIWVEKVKNGHESINYRFTGKEMDSETGLYYFGARYLDPKYSRWLSTDPALRDYIPQAPVNDEARKANNNLPGQGGLFNQVNFHLYHYAGNNPVRYIDPDGRWTESMKNAVKNAVKLEKTYTHGTWNNQTKTTENAWDCDVFVEYIINDKESGASLPTTFKTASETTVANHLKNMKDELKKSPEKGSNIVFHGGNHAMLLGVNDDGSVDAVHISSSNKDKKAFESHWKTLADFENHWKKQGNGDLKYVPLNDYVPFSNNNSNKITKNENEESGK